MLVIGGAASVIVIIPHTPLNFFWEIGLPFVAPTYGRAGEEPTLSRSDCGIKPGTQSLERNRKQICPEGTTENRPSCVLSGRGDWKCPSQGLRPWLISLAPSELRLAEPRGRRQEP